MKTTLHVIVAAAGVALALAAPAQASGVWESYLDYAYVYSSADPASLSVRLEEYGAEAGTSLRDWITERWESGGPESDEDDVVLRRKATAYLLDYLARGEPDSLERAADAARALEPHLGRHENRYWHHYVLAHQALEKGRRHDFVGELLDLWLAVVVPLEAPFESLQTLSLSEGPNSGFVSALPFVYENVARIILIRSQEMGVDRGLDPLGAIVRLLADGRVGGHPDVIPVEASSLDYLERIVKRLDGPESDAGSLTFTLALFEAAKHHDLARSLLASEGFTSETLEAIRLASGSYETALNRADTEQGRAAVYTRALRQIGEVFAAKQRLGVDPEIELPFSIEGAIEVYSTLHAGLPDGWAELGFARTGRQAWIDAMHLLWEEIQEATLNTADSYLARSVAEPHLADEHARNAARALSRYLSFFVQHATEDGKEGVPDSAYFAAHEAARGVGDAYFAYAQRPTRGEVALATTRYRNALELFPFDRSLWPALTASLERQGRETEYLSIARPVADWVTRSRSVATWIERGEPRAAEVAALKRAFADTQVIMYLGFAEAESIEDLEAGVAELEAERDAAEQRLAALADQRGDEPAEGQALPASIPDAPPEASATPAAGPGPRERARLAREMDEVGAKIARLEKQIDARRRALPVYRETLATAGLIPELRSARDHPVHTLLRRMYYERRPASAP